MLVEKVVVVVGVGVAAVAIAARFAGAFLVDVRAYNKKYKHAHGHEHYFYLALGALQCFLLLFFLNRSFHTWFFTWRRLTAQALSKGVVLI